MIRPARFESNPETAESNRFQGRSGVSAEEQHTAAIEEFERLAVALEACGIKVFMGASTGDMLVDDPRTLERIFEHAPVIVVTHCEDSPMIWKNEAKAREKFGDDVPFSEHPKIRSADACLASSKMAVDLATRHDALLHILHLTTAIEMGLFSSTLLLVAV